MRKFQVGKVDRSFSLSRLPVDQPQRSKDVLCTRFVKDWSSTRIEFTVTLPLRTRGKKLSTKWIQTQRLKGGGPERSLLQKLVKFWTLIVFVFQNQRRLSTIPVGHLYYQGPVKYFRLLQSSMNKTFSLVCFYCFCLRSQVLNHKTKQTICKKGEPFTTTQNMKKFYSYTSVLTRIKLLYTFRWIVRKWRT